MIMKNKLIICRGLQSSGKSTYAKAWANEDPTHRVRFNWDDCRNMMGKYWVPERENTGILKAIRDTFLHTMMAKHWDIIVDNMNLNPKDWDYYEELVRLFNSANQDQYELEYKDFFDVSVEECIKRDSLRPNPVGEEAIRATWKRYRHFIITHEIEKKAASWITYDSTKPDCIVVDIDSTISMNLSKREFYGKGWKEMLEFDAPVQGTIAALRAMKMTGTCDIIICTGRSEDGREATEKWLKLYQVPYDRLYMRATSDYSSGPDYKEKILKKFILPKYNVLYALDDEDKCVKMYRNNGIICLQP